MASTLQELGELHLARPPVNADATDSLPGTSARPRCWSTWRQRAPATCAPWQSRHTSTLSSCSPERGW